MGLHDRRLAVDLADAGGVMRIDDAVLHGLDRGGGDVDHDEALAEIARIGFEPDDVGLELLQPRLSRHVELGEHRLVDGAGLGEAVARLEALHRRLDERVVDRAVAGDRIEVARHDEALAQRLHPRALRTDLQVGPGGDLTPAALGDEVLILLDRRLGRRHGGGREDRRRFAPDRHFRRRFVALGPFRLIAVLRRRRKRGEARKGECGKSGRAKKDAARQPRDGHVASLISKLLEEQSRSNPPKRRSALVLLRKRSPAFS